MFGSTADLHKQRRIPRLRVPSRYRDPRATTTTTTARPRRRIRSTPRAQSHLRATRACPLAHRPPSARLFTGDLDIRTSELHICPSALHHLCWGPRGLLRGEINPVGGDDGTAGGRRRKRVAARSLTVVDNGEMRSRKFARQGMPWNVTIRMLFRRRKHVAAGRPSSKGN